MQALAGVTGQSVSTFPNRGDRRAVRRELVMWIGDVKRCGGARRNRADSAEPLLRVRAGRRLLTQARSAVFLDFLFVLTKLHFDFVNHAVDGRHQLGGLIFGDEVVLVLGIDAQLDLSTVFLFQVDREFDFRNPIEKADQLIQLRAKLLLSRFAQLSVACRDLSLHRDALSLKTNNGCSQAAVCGCRADPVYTLRLATLNVVGVTFETTNLSKPGHSNKPSSDPQRGLA